MARPTVGSNWNKKKCKRLLYVSYNFHIRHDIKISLKSPLFENTCFRKLLTCRSCACGYIRPESQPASFVRNVSRIPKGGLDRWCCVHARDSLEILLPSETTPVPTDFIAANAFTSLLSRWHKNIHRTKPICCQPKQEFQFITFFDPIDPLPDSLPSIRTRTDYYRGPFLSLCDLVFAG